MSEPAFTIAKAAEAAAVGVETIRYYERRGLVAQPVQPSAGYRRYGRNHIARIRFIKRAQDSMFPARSVRLVLALVLAVLPLQGFAETVHVFLCQPQGQANAELAEFAAPHHHEGHAHSGGGHAQGDHAAAHAHAAHGADADGVAASNGAATDGHAAHFCCDIVAAALPRRSSSSRPTTW